MAPLRAQLCTKSERVKKIGPSGAFRPRQESTKMRDPKCGIWYHTAKRSVGVSNNQNEDRSYFQPSLRPFIRAFFGSSFWISPSQPSTHTSFADRHFFSSSVIGERSFQGWRGGGENSVVWRGQRHPTPSWGSWAVASALALVFVVSPELCVVFIQRKRK